jgi:predicted MFS family arabinose efflux permease
MSSAELGTLASAEWFACITGTFLTKNKSIQELTRWVPWACALAIGANVAGILLVSHVPLILFHPLSTFGAGVAYGYVLKVFHASGKQERSFGIFVAVLYLSELAIFQLINYLTDKYTTGAVFYVYAVLALIALILSLVTRASLTDVALPQSVMPGGGRQKRLSTMILASVAALGVSYAAFGMMWPFVQLMGVARGFSALQVTNGTSAYAVTGIVGGLTSAALSLKANRATVLMVALCALLSSVYMLYAGASYTWFFLGCLIFGFYWTFYCTLHIGIIARADDTGRAIVLCGVSPSVGAIFGSFVGGHLIHGTNYLPLAYMGASLAVIGIACTLLTMVRMNPRKVLIPAPQVTS